MTHGGESLRSFFVDLGPVGGCSLSSEPAEGSPRAEEESHLPCSLAEVTCTIWSHQEADKVLIPPSGHRHAPFLLNPESLAN
jgi:hypothetical protein